MSTFKDVTLHFKDVVQNSDLMVKGIRSGSITVDPANLTAQTSAETQVTLQGIESGDVIMLNVPASLEAGLAFSGVRVSAANTIQVRLSNVTAGAIDGASRSWSYLYFDLT
jgi:hypothetical protein